MSSPTAKRAPRLLVITLFSGESEIDANKASVKAQRSVRADHRIIEHLGNVEAHEALYTMIMKEGHEYDLVIKLDADMVFRDSMSALTLLEYFRVDPNLSHLIVPVFDHPSRLPLMGINCYRGTVKWQLPVDPLFPDPQPIREGGYRVVTMLEEPLVDHMPSPSIEQMYIFGVHRTLKVMQRGKTARNPKVSGFHLKLIENIWAVFLETRDAGRAAVFFGFLETIRSGSLVVQNKSKIVYENQAARLDDLSVPSLISDCSPFFTPSCIPYWQLRLKYWIYPAAVWYLKSPARILKNRSRRRQKPSACN